ncbi:hypothetical protein J6590_042039 [Homalodisca vitripennis]|nr:hypothetical protein J6590_042039 [Homalodisca vitripennis]
MVYERCIAKVYFYLGVPGRKLIINDRLRHLAPPTKIAQSPGRCSLSLIIKTKKLGEGWWAGGNKSGRGERDSVGPRQSSRAVMASSGSSTGSSGSQQQKPSSFDQLIADLYQVVAEILLIRRPRVETAADQCQVGNFRLGGTQFFHLVLVQIAEGAWSLKTEEVVGALKEFYG